MSEGERNLRCVGTVGTDRGSAVDLVSYWARLRHVIVAVIGCTMGCTTSPPVPHNGGMRVVTEASLDAARRLWASTGITHYQYSPKCEGMIRTKRLEGSYPRVVVRAGTEVNSSGFDHFLNLTSATTMDGIFDQMQRILASAKYRSGTVDFEVQFHPTWGYPVRLYLGDTDVFDSFENCTITRVRRWRH